MMYGMMGGWMLIWGIAGILLIVLLVIVMAKLFTKCKRDEMTSVVLRPDVVHEGQAPRQQESG
ncbi:MAG: hypothetical protein ACR2G6_11765 [Gemmatimonadaceae bacterium]